ncbi:hypothetical protein CVT25_010229 [Psilocybe cyanescens]|uniref:Acyl carrier protein n=1 Tax=Psilocybe cyanescens TaxID=93625 RepID=A0A409XD00_PSICY|nr:hypothetical protein CVT25_010229 [Psilocybe cyanescens]
MSLARLIPRAAAISCIARTTPTLQTRWIPRAMYSAGGPLSKDVITSRILETLKGYEKINPAKLTTSASFSKDLGLDSLDAVEVMMAVEEEFSIEIPDAEADEITTVQQAIDYIAKSPEGPVYDPSTSLLHFVDISEKKVFHVNILNCETSFEEYDEAVCCLALRRDAAGLACAAAQGFALLKGDSKISYLYKPLSSEYTPFTRFNDGGCDSKGRFFAGTLYNKEEGIPGQLYKYDPATSSCKIDSNGLGWSADEKTFYFTDSLVNKIYAYDYNEGELSNKRVFVDAIEKGFAEKTYCDGLCVDDAGGVWSARWGGSRIVRFDKEGSIDFQLLFPTALNITSCCFGGPKNDIMFVTTAHCGAIGGDASLQQNYPDSGHIFQVDLSSLFQGVQRGQFAGNLVTSLFEHEQIKTTLPKARDTARLAEKIITMGKKGDNGARERASAFLLKPTALSKLFSTFAQRYAERPGGYTRIHKFGNRQGDNAPHAILELVDNPRDLRWEMTSRAIGWELLKDKLRTARPEQILNDGGDKALQVLRLERKMDVKEKGVLRSKTRWNVQKILRYRGADAITALSKKASTYADELLATPLAYKSVHDDLKEQNSLTPAPRRRAGYKRIGEERPALVVARGALAQGVTPSRRKKAPVYSMENALTEGFKYP